MHKQTQPTSCSLPPSDQDCKKPSMACQQVGADETTGRSSVGADDAVSTHIGAEDHVVPSAPADDFEFCILSTGGLAPAGDDAAADMCVADEVFSGGKLLPLRLSSAASADASSTLLLLRSDSLDGASTAASSSTTTSSSDFSSRSVSRSSSCVSRSTSSNSASSDNAAAVPGTSPSRKQSVSSAAAALPPRRSLSGSVFYAHPSPSPCPPPPRRSRTTAAARCSTGSAPPASWGVIRLGVVGAPEVYSPRPARSGSGSARFERQHRTQSSAPAEKKLPLGMLGAGLVCSCSPDAVAPVGSAEVAAAEARRRRKKAEEKKRSATVTAKQSGKGTAPRRGRILEWLEDLSISKEKSTASSCR